VIILRRRLDDWLTDSPVSAEDLSLFRVFYALFVLLTLWRSDYAAYLPATTFDPPSGPFALLGSAPPLLVIWLLEAMLSVALAALAIGWHTRVSAVVSAALQIALYGIGYSYGKIDHTIFLPLVALLLSFSAWGSDFSVDARQRGVGLHGHSWAPRCLAVAIGVGTLTAGLAKLRGGWLSWDSQATFGYLVLERDIFSAPLDTTAFLSSIDHPVVWEILDYGTVFLECGMILAVLRWRTFYLGIAALAMFHFFIALTVGIVFPYNLPAYAAFIPWSKLRRAIPTKGLDRFTANLASNTARRWLTCSGLASLSLLIAWVRPAWFVPGIYAGVVTIGAVVGGGYLAVSAWRLCAASGKRKAELSERRGPQPDKSYDAQS